MGPPPLRGGSHPSSGEGVVEDGIGVVVVVVLVVVGMGVVVEKKAGFGLVVCMGVVVVVVDGMGVVVVVVPTMDAFTPHVGREKPGFAHPYAHENLVAPLEVHVNCGGRASTIGGPA